MKKIQLLMVLAVAAAFAACGGGATKASYEKKDLIGQWEPQKIEVEVPKVLKDEVDESSFDALNEMLQSVPVKPWIKLNEDGTCAQYNVEYAKEVEGVWSLEGSVIKLELADVEMPLDIVELKDGELHLDFAEATKAMIGQGNNPLLKKLKVVMIYKKI